MPHHVLIRRHKSIYVILILTDGVNPAKLGTAAQAALCTRACTAAVMGRKTRAAATVVGATPASALPAPFPGLKGGLGLEEELRSGSSRGGREPRKLPVSRFFVAPPRTALLETADGSTGADVIKRIAKDTAAPVGLGTLSASAVASACSTRDRCCV